MFVVMVSSRVASANLYHDPCNCILVGLVMVFRLLGLLTFVCDLGWQCVGRAMHYHFSTMLSHLLCLDCWLPFDIF